MAREQIGNLIDHLRRAVLAGGEANLTDGQLLECFVNSRDGAALAALVRRHGPMVWGVCRRLLHNHHDVEDAFQATFLVLVRKAASIRPREMVGNWLYGVARQTALKARMTTAKRQAREKQVTAMPEPEVLTEPEPWPDLERLLDQELSRLPDKYRAAIVLCDLEGKTRKDVARQLKIPEGTLSSRLTTARAMLAKRLARHGLAVSAGTLAAVLPEKAGSACVPTSVLSSTIEAATLLAAGQATAAGVISVSVVALTEGVLKTMLLNKLKIAAMVVLVMTLIGLSTTAITYRTWASDQAGATNESATKATAPAAKAISRAGPQLLGGDRPEAGAEDNEKRAKQPEGQSSTKPKLQALFKERLEILKKMADRMKQLHQQNAVDQEAVQKAELRVYKAELDLCRTTRDRIAVLEKIANVYKQKEDRVSQLVKTGAASSEIVLEARLARLEAEIAIEQEKAKLAVSPPR